MTASMPDAGTGVGCQLRSRHSLAPWNMPQSISTWNPALPLPSGEVLTRCFEPVTVPAAPRNWMYAKSLPPQENYFRLLISDCRLSKPAGTGALKSTIYNLKSSISFRRLLNPVHIVSHIAFGHAAVIQHDFLGNGDRLNTGRGFRSSSDQEPLCDLPLFHLEDHRHLSSGISQVFHRHGNHIGLSRRLPGIDRCQVEIRQTT